MFLFLTTFWSFKVCLFSACLLFIVYTLKVRIGSLNLLSAVIQTMRGDVDSLLSNRGVTIL